MGGGGYGGPPRGGGYYEGSPQESPRGGSEEERLSLDKERERLAVERERLDQERGKLLELLLDKSKNTPEEKKSATYIVNTSRDPEDDKVASLIEQFQALVARPPTADRSAALNGLTLEMEARAETATGDERRVLDALIQRSRELM